MFGVLRVPGPDVEGSNYVGLGRGSITTVMTLCYSHSSAVVAKPVVDPAVTSILLRLGIEPVPGRLGGLVCGWHKLCRSVC